MDEKFSRTEMLIGNEGMEKLKNAKVAVFGLGGVGSFVCEGFARSGVGSFILVDYDKVDETNINRQIIATTKTIGRNKVDVMKERILDINPDAKVEIYQEFFLADSTSDIITEDLSYVVDCVDTIMAKIAIICKSKEIGVPVISCMGTGNRLDPSLLTIKDIYKTYGDPLAKVMRHELRKRNVESLDVCCSTEDPIRPLEEAEEDRGNRRSVPASSAFVPPSAGILIASHVVRHLICEPEKPA